MLLQIYSNRHFFTVILSLPDKPFDNNKTVSFVEVSPSTEIMLNVSLMSSFKASVKSSFEILISVVIKP